MVGFFNRFGTAALAAALVFSVAACNRGNTAQTATSGSTGAETGEALADADAVTAEELETLRENFRRVHFDFDRADLSEEGRNLLTENAEILLRRDEVFVRIEGHADHWGSDEYNLALGQSRAEAVRNYLTALGVPEGRLTLISFGEEKPLVGEGDRTVESPNRRAEFVVTAGPESVESSY